jgi:endonuclease YncB( thermonuclease family)
MSQKSKEESVLTIKEVALYLTVTERSIYRLTGAKLKAHSSRALTNGLALLSAFTFSVSCLAGDVIQGRVVSVSDGDTITLLDADHQQHKIRLSGIDAPEKAQPFGQRSKENLSRLIFGRDVAVEWRKKDRYGRTVGKVMVAEPACREAACPKILDACHAQIVAGMAWWYRQYAKEQESGDANRYEQSELEARARRIGLWSDPQPTPPWEWRKEKKSHAR